MLVLNSKNLLNISQKN